MGLLSLVFLLGSIWAVNAIHQHDLNPALIEVRRAAARAHAGNQVSAGTLVSDPVRAMEATAAGLGILYMKKGTELRTVMGIDPTDKEAIRDMPTFFKTPSGNDPSGAYCKKGRFITTWKTVKDLRLIVHPGTYNQLKKMDSAFLEECGKPEKTKFMWRGGVEKGDLSKATPCELGHDVCADIDPKKEYDVKALSELMSAEAARIFKKAKASCTTFFGLIKTPDLAKDKYKYLCNTNYDPANIGDQHDVAYASALMFGTYYDGYINKFEVVLFGYPSTINSVFYKPKSWLPLVELVKSTPCP